MINRVLIRTKVIQLLYSFMLVEQHFSLESQATPPTKERRFAYTLYMDTLVLMDKIATAVSKRGGHYPLHNRFINAIESDERLKSLLKRYQGEPFPYESMIPALVEEITESVFYKNYLKDKEDNSAVDTAVWKNIFNSFIIDNPRLRELSENRENYSARAFDRCKEMMADTFANYLASQGNVPDALKNLRLSFDKARELYFRLLLLPVDLTNLQDLRLDEAKHKYLPTQEDLYPNLRFVDNALVKELRSNRLINDYASEHKLNLMAEDPMLLHNLLKAVLESDIYKEYMEFPVTDLRTDCEFWKNIFRNVILNNETLLEALEEKSIFWNDDLEIISTFVLKTFKRIESNLEDTAKAAETGDLAYIPEEPVLEMYKDEEDSRFGSDLFAITTSHKDEYLNIIYRHLNTSTWDAERLAFMDVVIILTALAEILNFPKIPLTVSINEYLEIAKSYSTPKSAHFIHGVLGAIIKELQDTGVLLKK